MTTPLDALKAALEAKREAEREWEKYADVLVPSEESRHAALIVGRARNRMVALLTDDTIAALIAVAEADDPEPCGICRECDGCTMCHLWVAWDRRQVALAPLVKEDTDVRG